MKKRLLLLFILLLTLPATLAHDPDIETEDWGLYDDPYIIVDAAISYALYGYIGEDDVDVFEINYFGDEDALLVHEILVPVCGEHYTDFYPHYAILAPQEYADSSLQIPVAIPEGYGVFWYEEPTVFDDDDEDREVWTEFFSQKTYYREVQNDLEYPAEGTYYVVVFSPDGQTGDYSLAVGYEEVFLSDQDETAQEMLALSDDSWMHRDCSLAPDDPNAVINLDIHDGMPVDMSDDDNMGDMDMSNFDPLDGVTDDLDLDLTQITETTTITITSELQPIELNTLHNWVITVLDADGNPVENAVVSFDGGMPAHEHGLPTAPQVTELGEGQYLVEGVRFQMPGWWQFNVSVEVDGETDQVEFNVIPGMDGMQDMDDMNDEEASDDS